jgi:YVTN family beta-propeller protein
MAGPFAYVADFLGNAVVVIDTSTDTITATIAIPSSGTPFSIAASTSWVYTVDDTNNIVYQIDPSTNAIVGTITNPSFLQLRGCGITPDGSTLWVGDVNAPKIYTYDIPSNTPGPTSIAGAFDFCTFSPDGSAAFLTSGFEGTGNIAIFDVSTVALTATITATGLPFQSAITADGTTLYVAAQSVSLSPDTVDYCDTATATETGVVPMTGLGRDNTWGCVISPDGSTIFATNAFADVAVVIATATNTVTTSVANGTTGAQSTVALNPAGTKLYIPEYIHGHMLIFDTASDTFAAPITGLGGPIAVTFPYEVIPPPSGGGTAQLSPLFISRKTQDPPNQPDYGTDMRTIERWAQSFKLVGGSGITITEGPDGTFTITSP